ncbi:MAG: hypothetical protein Ct9H300mP1_37470 [Planctomycetaceae bacterium]|nr:MAG: hypothetical protein Ct9H300mP1_37470 [Planctomycetaceae bacterium]
MGGAIQEHVDRCRHASPLTYVDSRDAPFLIVHGDRDESYFSASQLLQAALKKAAVPVALVTVKGGGHGVRGRPSRHGSGVSGVPSLRSGSLPSDQVLTRTSRRRQPR